MGINKLIDRLDGVKKTPNGYRANCPAHTDKKSHLSIAQASDGRVLLKCHRGCGCTAQDVVQAVGLEMKDLFPPNPSNGRSTRQLVGKGSLKNNLPFWPKGCGLPGE